MSAARPRRSALRRDVRRRVRRLLLPLLPPDGQRWDRQAGVETEEQAEPADLTVETGSSAQGHSYVPTPPRLVRVWLDPLPDRLVIQSTFLDMGSGRGRVLLMASERPFRRVIGVEFATELHDAALENIRRFDKKAMRCSDVESILGDAAAFVFPLDPLVVYFNNPFSEQIMKLVVVNLAFTYEQLPRPIVVVYQQAIHERPDHETNNIGLLDRQSFLEGRTIRFPIRDRLYLSPFLVRLYSTREAIEHF